MKLLALVKGPASIFRYLATVGEATEVRWPNLSKHSTSRSTDIFNCRLHTTARNSAGGVHRSGGGAIILAIRLPEVPVGCGTKAAGGKAIYFIEGTSRLR
jgi:hypothetical protein